MVLLHLTKYCVHNALNRTTTPCPGGGWDGWCGSVKLDDAKPRIWIIWQEILQI